MAVGAVIGIISLIVTAAAGTYSAVSTRQTAKLAEDQAEKDAAASAARIEAEAEQEKLDAQVVRAQAAKESRRARARMEVAIAASGQVLSGTLLDFIGEQAAVDEQTIQQMSVSTERRQLGFRISKTNILRRGANLAAAFRFNARQNMIGGFLGTSVQASTQLGSLTQSNTLGSKQTKAAPARGAGSTSAGTSMYGGAI